MKKKTSGKGDKFGIEWMVDFGPRNNEQIEK